MERFKSTSLMIISIFLLQSCSESTSLLTDSTTTPTTTTTSLWELEFTNGVGKLLAPSYDSQHYFGNGVAVGDFNGDGNPDLAVGAPFSDINTSLTNGADTGAVYIYYSMNLASVGTAADLYLSPGTDVNSQYGFNLHAGDVNNDGIDDLMVGAPHNDIVGADTGSVYIYKGTNAGISSLVWQTLNHPNSTINATFGSSMFLSDLDGDGYKDLVVGSYQDDTTALNVGGLWVLTGQSDYLFTTGAATQLTLSAALDTTQDYCGWSVHVHDYNNDGLNDIYMGCPRSEGPLTDAGTVFIYNGTGVQGTWVTTANTPDTTIVNPSPLASDYFGNSIATMDYDNDGKDDLLVGAQLADDGFASSGAIYAFSDIRTSINIDVVYGPPFSQITPANYGTSMVVADTNGDSLNDLIVGAPLANYPDKGYAHGRVSVIAGVLSGNMDFTTELKSFYYDYHKSPAYERKNANAYFGTAVCNVDFNNDGLKDLVVGAYHDDSQYADDGAAYVYYATTAGSIRSDPDVRLYSVGPYNSATEYGSACLGMDVNRDGYEDLLMSAWQDDASVSNAGVVYIYLGTASGIGTAPSLSFKGPNTINYYFGHYLAKGDLDNDGFDDIIVGAPYSDIIAADAGAIYVFQSNSTTGIVDINNYTQFTHTGSVTLDYLGWAVQAYDYDGDGDMDLIGGAPGDDTPAAASGVVYIWRNGTNGTTAGVNTLLDTTHDSTILAPIGTLNYAFGSGMARGLYTNSTYEDLIIGAHGDDLFGGDAGAVHIYEGTATGYDAVPTSIRGLDPPADDAAENLGHAVTIFDFNRDGTNDIIISAPYDDKPGTNSGSVYIKTQ